MSRAEHILAEVAEVAVVLGVEAAANTRRDAISRLVASTRDL